MIEVRVASRLRTALAFTGVQSTVAAFGGDVSVPTNTQIGVRLPPYAPREKLEALYSSHDPNDPLLKLSITVLLAGQPTATEAIVSYSHSPIYLIDALGISESTVDAFVRTLQQTFRAIEGGRRPPDRPPPPR